MSEAKCEVSEEQRASALELFDWLDVKFGEECGHNHSDDGDRPPAYGARTASVNHLAQALAQEAQRANKELAAATGHAARLEILWRGYEESAAGKAISAATARVAELEKQLAVKGRLLAQEEGWTKGQRARADAAEARADALEKQLADTDETCANLMEGGAEATRRADAAEAELARLRALPDGPQGEARRLLASFDMALHRELCDYASNVHHGMCTTFRALAEAILPSAQQIPAPATPPNADAESLFRFHEAALPLAQAAMEYRADYWSDQPHATIQKSLDKMVKVARRSSRLADFFVNDRNAKALAPDPAPQATPEAEGRSATPAKPPRASWSVVRGQTMRSVFIVTPDGDAVAEVFGNPAHLETAPDRAEAICAAHNAAPAQPEGVGAAPFRCAVPGCQMPDSEDAHRVVEGQTAAGYGHADPFAGEPSKEKP